MRLKWLATLTMMFATAGCVAPEELTPMQGKLRNVGLLEVASNNCAGILGYEGLSKATKTRAKLLKEAKAMGATNADIAAGYNAAGTAFAVASGIGGAMNACSSIVQSSITIIETS
jgi:hypothetical protein